MTKDDKAMVCVCVYTSGMDWHREGWTGEAIVRSTQIRSLDVSALTIGHDAMPFM